jgi:mono/diheme cytochrome c family protein
MSRAPFESCCAALALTFTLTACSGDKAPAPAAPAAQGPATAAAQAAATPAGPTAEDKTQAAEIFTQRCTPCHGPQGAGDGPASASLTPKPRNFTDAAWQTEVTDEHIEKIIAYGGAAVGRSPAMPANPDLAPKKGVLQALRMHIRGLKK